MKCFERKQHCKHFKIINVISSFFRGPMSPNLYIIEYSSPAFFKGPPIFTLLSTPPQPSLLASVYKVISGWGWPIGLCSDPAEFTHHCKSLRDNSHSCINASKLPLFKRKAPVLSMFSDLKCKGPSFAAGKFDMSNPRVDATSLIVGCGHCNRP